MPTKDGRRQESALTVGMMLSKDVYLTAGALNLGDYIMLAAQKRICQFLGNQWKRVGITRWMRKINLLRDIPLLVYSGPDDQSIFICP